MDLLKTFLENHLQLLEEDWILIKDKLEVIDFSKNQVLTKQGHVENRLYFLQSGVVRLYYEAENKDITLNFAFPESFISSYTSFLTGDKSEFVLETLTPCKLAYFSRSDLEELYTSTQCGHQLSRILTENLFLYLSKRESDFLIKSPTQRYLDLFTEQPRLIQEIPQKYLASYIGITPQALSRIRAKMVQGIS
jgi:CRP-like cAMP-binding protein